MLKLKYYLSGFNQQSILKCLSLFSG